MSQSAVSNHSTRGKHNDNRIGPFDQRRTGKTTVTANLGAFCADAGIRTLLIDLDTQPSLSSFYRLEHEAPGGTYQLISQNNTRADQVISRTCIPNLSLILSNDPHNQLSNMLLYAADGRLRLKNLVPAFADDFDLILIDTQGARSVTLETALLCSDLAISPITPDMLAAREFYRGTQQLLKDLEPLSSLGVHATTEHRHQQTRRHQRCEPDLSVASGNLGRPPANQSPEHHHSCCSELPPRCN